MDAILYHKPFGPYGAGKVVACGSDYDLTCHATRDRFA